MKAARPLVVQIEAPILTVALADLASERRHLHGEQADSVRFATKRF